jgi:DNA excision repair protein ERCC-2
MNILKKYFPYDKIRPMQIDLIADINKAIINKTNLIAHAPTGLGKTVAALLPSIIKSKNDNLKVIFLTSRNTQHILAMNTLKDIKAKFSNVGVDLLGRKHLCLQALPNFSAGDLAEYCKLLKKENKCKFYSNFKKSEKLTTEGKLALAEATKLSPLSGAELYSFAEDREICPYELSLELTKKSDVIIADYQFIFNPHIRKLLLNKIEKNLDELIIVVDEAHNLPNRIKGHASQYFTSLMLKASISESKKFELEEITDYLVQLLDILKKFSNNLSYGEEEIYITKQDFIDEVNKVKDYEELMVSLEVAAEHIREKEQRSRIGGVANFLTAWLGQDKGFTRIFTKKNDKNLILAYKCLDPSISSKDVVNNCHSCIMMSGTLTPTNMYKKLLGFDQTEEKIFKSPFPEKNRELLIVPKTTTKFTKRNEAQYKSISNELKNIVENVPGNVAIFFPSYFISENVSKYFSIMTSKTVFTEVSNLTGQERSDILTNFKKYKNQGAVLLGVLGGSFSEGVDLPGENLKAVVVVGLPLQKPDLETKALIEYFDNKFHKGWDFGYLFPAFNKTLQGAGRCIRSETDKGVIIFLDERYIWNNYRRCFPATWNVRVSVKPERELKKFFNN